MNDNLHISNNGLNFIKNWEGCILHIYLDIVKVATIGVGHVVLPAEKASGIYNNGINLQQALDILAKDIARFEEAIKNYVKVELNQNQFDALCSLSFNVGTGVFINSGLIKALNAGNYSQVPSELLKWCKAGGKVNQGLLNRRKSEATLFAKVVEHSNITVEVSLVENSQIPTTELIMPDIILIAVPEAIDAPLKLSPWQSIVNVFLKLFK